MLAIIEELAAMHSVKGTTTGSDLFVEVSGCLDRRGAEMGQNDQNVINVGVFTLPISHIHTLFVTSSGLINTKQN